MTYRRAVLPALAGALLLTALLWWAGASAHALHLSGATGMLDGQTAAELERWLTPWSYDPPTAAWVGTEVSGGSGGADGAAGTDYRALYSTALQIRFGAVFAFFIPGALLLVRRLPPVRGRMPAALLALWAWGLVAGTLAVTVSAPWLIASGGHGSFRFLPHLAGVISSGRQVLIVTALVAAAVTVLAARVAAKGTGPLSPEAVPARAARLAASVGTALIALSLVVLSYQPVAAALQQVSPNTGLLAEPGDLLRQWLLLGAWDTPDGGQLGGWLLYRAVDVLPLAVVWWALRRLPGLLTRATVPAMAVGTVCATVFGLLTSQLLRMAVNGAGSDLSRDLLRLSADLGNGVPAALTCGLVAGSAAALTLRVAAGRAGTADATTSAQDSGRLRNP
ncbi:hypothetical protein ACFXPQ_09270 [Streptomyces lydicus]|uniref:hypothetical protein n=1 Tax=Streptomyces lydicus TaxID=47763 RepID=UPI0036BE7776